MKVRLLTWIIAIAVFLSHITTVFAAEENGGQSIGEFEDITAGQKITDNTEEAADTGKEEIFSDFNLKQTNWADITSAKMFLSEMEAGVTYRYEVFYDTYTARPEVLLISPTGFIHKPGQSSLYTEKAEQVVSGYHNVKYNVFYITSDEAGTWKLSITPADGQKFLCVIKTKTPEKWESVTQDKKADPEELLTWYMHEAVFHDTDLQTIVSAEDKTQGGMQSVDPPVKEPEPPADNSSSGNMTLIFVAVIAVCCIVVIVSQVNKKRKKETAEKKRQQRIEAANKALAEEREKENEHLAEIVLQHEAEYIDYPDPVNYYEKSIQDGLQKYPEKNSEIISTEKPQEIELSSINTQPKEEKTEDTIINYF